MKKLFTPAIFFFCFLAANSQNVAVNNDGSSAATSAMLDVKSTTKGFMMPRVTSAQRTAIASPALGLLVFDTDTKTIWAHDGSSWKNLYTSGGGLTLPFSQTVNTATSAFQITNQGAGAAIEGSSSAQFGIGMTAKATGEGSWGLFAFSNGAGSQSIRSYADNGTAFHGENNNPANTNTLMNLLNKGAGTTSRFQLANTNSTAANVLIAGNHLGNQLKIYQTNVSNSEAAVSIENSGTGAGIEATSTTGYGVKGVTNTATGFAGVHGQNNGTAGSGVVGVSHAANTQGVYGTSNNGIGVRGLSSSGTALYGNSATGYALESNGKVKIAGGNTNPSAGAVLTSDANGNATWQQPSKIGFRGQGSNLTFNSFPVDNWYKVIFSGESYDFGNNFTSYGGTLPFANASLFTVPVNGVYNLGTNLHVLVNGALLEDDFSAYIRFGIIRSGNAFYTEQVSPSYTFDIDSDPDQIIINIRTSDELYLHAGDQVFVQFLHGNSENVPAIVANYSDTNFHGRLVIAD